MEIKIEKLDHKGKGIGYLNGKTYFVKDALPSEIVKINVYKEKRKIAFATVLEYIKKSSERIDPLCPYFNECGGCHLQMMSYDKENEFKENKVKEIMSKYAGLNPNLIEEIQFSKERYGYRNKVTLKALNKIGYFKERTNDIVEIEKCIIANDKINHLLGKIKLFEGLKEIVIKTSKDDNLLSLKSSSETGFDVKNFEDFNNIVLNDNVVKNNSYIIKKIKDKKYKVSYDSFFQINDNMNQILYDLILNNIKQEDKNIIDLYSGSGTISLYIDKENVTGIEKNKSAIKDALENKKLNNNKLAKFICADANLEGFKYIENNDIIIVDPPRAGLGVKLIEPILKSNVKKIIYVSCDPMTLARDLNFLKEKYEIKKITPVNMFPSTYHVECVAVLSLI